MSDEIIQALPLPAVLIDPEERIAIANEKACVVFGQGILGRNYVTVLRQPSLLDAVETAVRLGQRATTTYQSTEARKDITWHATVTPLESADGRRVLVVLEDRTALRDADKMRRDFVANVSHELRTPLTAMQGFIETLRGAARNDPDARDRFLSIMEQESHRMTRLVLDLLSLSRVEAEERVRPTGQTDLVYVLDRVVTTLTPMAEDRSIQLNLVGLNGKTVVAGDQDQLGQVFTNLIENALKYSGSGASVSVSLRQDEWNETLRAPAVVVTIADTGDGFDPIHISRLTERFYRIDGHRSREMGGTGLGLAIVKHIVNRHRGRLRIESVPGQGSEFTVILPSD